MTDSKTYIIDANNVCLRRDRDKLTPEEEQEIQKLKEMIIEEHHKVLKESEAMKRSQIDCFFEAINENAPSAKTLLKIGGVALAAGAAAYGLKKMYTP